MSPELRGRLGVVSLLAGVTAIITGPGFTFLFVYGENVLVVPPGFMAVIVLGAGLMGFLGLLLGRWAADRLGRRVTAGVTTALLAFSATLTYSGSIAAMTAGYLAAVALGAAFGPAAGALLTELFPTSDRSTASGWTAATGVLGAVAGLALFGAFIELLAASRWRARCCGCHWPRSLYCTRSCPRPVAPNSRDRHESSSVALVQPRASTAGMCTGRAG